MKVRIVMEVLYNSSTIAQIFNKYNVASCASYKWRDELISKVTDEMELGKFTASFSFIGR